MEEFLGKVQLTDGVERTVYRDGDGPQYILDESNRVHGVADPGGRAGPAGDRRRGG